MPGDDRPPARVQKDDTSKAIRTSRVMIRDSQSAMDASRAAMHKSPPSSGGADRPPVILQLGPRDFSVLAWVRDEDAAPVCRVAKDEIKAASTAALFARKLQQK